TFTFSSTQPGSSFRCKVDAGSYAPCSSPKTLGRRPDGAHTFRVQAKSGAGTLDPTPASRSFTVDTARPDTTLTSGPSDPTNNPTPAFTFTSSQPGSSFACRVDSAPYAACPSPNTVPELTDGSHQFQVRATDKAGNVDATPASLSFTVAAAPNVLVIETDDQTLESMKVMQNVNSLIGAQGATFANSFVNFALCCPSRATFLTGQYAHNHGVIANRPPEGGFDRFEELHADNNLAVWLQAAGYHTGLIGKYLNDYGPDPLVPPGWSEWHVPLPVDQNAYDYNFDDNGVSSHYGHDVSDFKQDVLTRKAVNFLGRRASKVQPFFLWLTYTAPHIAGPNPNPRPPADCKGAPKPAPRHAHAFDSEPLPMSPNFNEADVSDKPVQISGRPLLDDDQIAEIQRKYRCQLESLLSVDEGVKKVIDALEAAGELDDTLIVYTSDNGYFNGEHRIPSFKGHIYEESIRVPLEIRGPGIPADVTIDPLVINADLAPTILQVASAARPGLLMDGRSLIPIAQHPGTDRGRELLVEQPEQQSNPTAAAFEAIRTERYMYAEHNTGETELYDLDTDPFELRNVTDDDDYEAVRAQLAERLAALKTCAGSSCLAQSGP
ncbi:MAG TPA: sulfatase-like hydrolase/transferase, partial [Solirubrobacterales bacterium]